MSQHAKVYAKPATHPAPAGRSWVQRQLNEWQAAKGQ